MSHILRTSTEHKTASLADEDNSAYCQSSGAHNIKHEVLYFVSITKCNIDAGKTRSKRKPYLFYVYRD